MECVSQDSLGVYVRLYGQKVCLKYSVQQHCGQVEIYAIILDFSLCDRKYAGHVRHLKWLVRDKPKQASE